MSKSYSLKLTKFALLLPFLMTSTSWADNASAKLENFALTDDQLLLEQQRLEQQLSAANKLEDERLSAEVQAQMEQRLSDMIGNNSLQFKSLVAKIYAENEYILLWEDKAAEKEFLREYAAMVMSGISKRSATNLEQIYQASAEGGLVYDILLTDAFLDYLYYTQNTINFAQKWLYSVNGYKGEAPKEQTIEAWLSAVKRNQALSFVQSRVPNNTQYKQTLNYIAQQLSGKQDKNALTDLYKLAINTQRLRVIPNFDNGLYVNIPSYQLNYYRDGKLVLSSKVIVGRKERKTPVMYSKLSNVVVNPPWNAPTRLINEDLVPKIKRDPGYVARNGYTILDGKGNAVDPYSINWEKIGKNFPYRIRQAPGDSALGNYKFNMPSSDAIYLHDTPSRGLFGKNDRALSSGCVRVEKSDQLATVLLKEAGWSEARKSQVLESRKTTSANISSDNPVYLYYVTAWVENGKIQRLPDIYGYDVTPSLGFINLNAVKKYL